MTVRWLQGDCRKTLQTLDTGVAQAVVTSPPYYGLRDYGTPPLVWGGDPTHTHAWGTAERAPWANELPSAKSGTRRNNAYHESMSKTAGQFCSCCAWLGSLGLEPTPDLYIEHMVEIFRHVRNTLRDDGVLWLNLGDSFAGIGKGPSNSLNRSNPHSHEAGKALRRGTNRIDSTPQQWLPVQRIGPQEHSIGIGRAHGYKPKDLMLLPFRVALALQADGWTLRAHLPWLKRNCMPGSEKDRPTISTEEVFLFSKKRRYYWDYAAARRAGSGWIPRSQPTSGLTGTARARAVNGRTPDRDGGYGNGETRNWRTGDMFFDSWQGLLTDDLGDPIALILNPSPYSGSHFAFFPPKLVEPMIKASTRPGDVVLDPFGGAGTVGLVADRLQRNAILCELKTEYADMGAARIIGDAPLFAEVDGGGRDAAD